LPRKVTFSMPSEFVLFCVPIARRKIGSRR
jgi:hypothetical protein